MTLRNRLSWPNDRAILFRSGRLSLATQVEVEAENAVLRHQSIELSLRLHGRVRLSDRSQVILGSLTSAFWTFSPSTKVRLRNSLFEMRFEIVDVATSNGAAMFVIVALCSLAVAARGLLRFDFPSLTSIASLAALNSAAYG
jgi:hypothetical protein